MTDRPGGPETRQRLSRAAVYAIVFTVALAAVSVWLVKILGPRAINPDYFCNCTVAEGLAAMFAWPILAIGCLVFGMRLRRAGGASRIAGVVAGIAAIAFPVLTILAVIFRPFPTIEELHGWTIALR